MIKVQSNDNEFVTKGFLRETINNAIEGLAATLNKSFIGLETRLESRMSGMAQQKDLLALTERVDRLDSRFDKLEQHIDGRFDKIFSELKDIRKEINNNSADITHLEFRLKKLEKKAGLQ